MGREIDLTKPLSAEDREWLEQRGKYGDLRIADEYNPPAAADSEPDEGETSDSGSDYDGWSKAQLQYELSTRDLTTTGTKAELVERLLEDDAAKAAGDAGDDGQS